MAKHKEKQHPQKAAKSSEIWQKLFSNNRTYFILLLFLLLFFFMQIVFKKGFFWEDFLEQNFPYRLFAARALHDGVFPFWNPYIFGGLPFYADVQTGILFPTNLILTIFVTGRWLSSYTVEIVMILHLLIAGIGMFYFGQENKLSKATAFFMGLVYMLNGHFIVHLTHTQQVQTFVLIPFIFLFLVRAFNKPGFGGILSSVVCGLLLGMAALAGYPQAVAIIATGLFLYLIYEIIIAPKRTGFLIANFAIIAIISLAIAAVQYIPTFSLFKQTLRGTYSYAEIVEGSFHPLRFITFLIPNFFGTTAQGNFSSYFGPGPYYQFWEQMAYLGIIPLILAGFSFYKNNRKAVYAPVILIAVSLLIGLGRHFPLHILLYKFVPFFNNIRTPAKYLNLTIFGIVWLSGIGLENILTLKPKAKRLVLFGILLSIFCLVSIMFLPQQISRAAKSIARTDVIRGVIFIIAGIGLIKAFLSKKIKQTGFVVLISIVAFLDLFTWGFKYNSGSTDPELYWGSNRIVNYFKSEQEKEYFRVNVRSKEGLILPRNIGYVQEFSTTDGYNPLSLQRFQKASQVLDRERFFTLMNVKYKTALDSATRRLGIVTRDFYLPRVQLFYDWEINNDEDRLVQTLNQPDFPLDKRVMLESDIGIPEYIDMTVANGRAKIISYSLNKIEVEVQTQSQALLVLSENYFPNWHVRINRQEKPVIPVDYFLRGCVVPAGNSRVEFYYHEKYFPVLFVICLITILLSVILIISCNLFRFSKSNN